MVVQIVIARQGTGEGMPVAAIQEPRFSTESLGVKMRLMNRHPTSQDPTAAPVVADHVVITPGVCGGRPRVAGHRITVQNIVLCHERGGLSPDEIASKYPGVTLADIHAALAYYYDHRTEIDARIESDRQFAEQLRAQSSSLLQQKLAQRNAQDDSLPPG
jgi:uncharacterized protein (DUF433 family)